MRDTQRKKLYTAEAEAFPQLKAGNMSMSDIKVFVQEVINSDYYQSQNGWKRIAIKDGRGRKSGYYFSAQRAIALPKFARTPWYCIHELSHALAHKTVGDAKAGHHATFCTHYANLVAEMVSVEDARRLIEAYDKHRVIYQLNKLTFLD